MKYKIKGLMKTDISKVYILGVGLICLLLIGGFFSYALFTVSKEKSNAISIVTGNLIYKLEVDGEEGDTLTVPANSSKEFIITLSNPNNRIARFNFYYKGDLPEGVSAGYKVSDGVNTPPVEAGINLEKVESSGSSNTYIIRVSNKSSSEVTINLGVSVGLDYNDLALPSNGHLFEEVITTGPVSDIVIDNLSSGSTYDDGTDTFITGENPNNYIWYSGKLWRAVSVNNEVKTTKLVTQWNISAISYDNDSSAFEGSYMQQWLNDTSADGFLGNLRDYENFIVTDAKWNATTDNTSLGSITRPRDDGTVVTDTVGLLNMYEYQTSYIGTTYGNGYLNNGLFWWTLTPYNTSRVRLVFFDGFASGSTLDLARGVRPSINLKSSVRIADGDGTIDNPYRLNGDNDTNLSGTLLSSRYSGEYIRFGNDENNLYRIVSHENGSGTKIVSDQPLKSSGNFLSSVFDSNSGVSYSSSNTIGAFLNGEYLTNYVDTTYSDMIEDSTTWYLGTVGSGTSYKLAKYTDTNMSSTTSSTIDAKVGLLRFGELMAGQFDRNENNTDYWTLTPYNTSYVRNVDSNGNANYDTPPHAYGVRPSINLKSSVQITSGTGVKSDPFVLTLDS